MFYCNECQVVGVCRIFCEAFDVGDDFVVDVGGVFRGDRRDLLGEFCGCVFVAVWVCGFGYAVGVEGEDVAARAKSNETSSIVSSKMSGATMPSAIPPLLIFSVFPVAAR